MSPPHAFDRVDAKLAHEAVCIDARTKTPHRKILRNSASKRHTTSTAHRRGRSVSSTLILSCRSDFALNQRPTFIRNCPYRYAHEHGLPPDILKPPPSA